MVKVLLPNNSRIYIILFRIIGRKCFYCEPILNMFIEFKLHANVFNPSDNS